MNQGTATMTAAPRNKAVNIGLWILQILTALAFLMAGIAKLTGNPMMVEVFNKVGMGQWFRYLTGLIEVVCALLLLIPATVPIGALFLICTMIGATFAHLFILGGAPIAPLVLLIFSLVIAWGRRDRLMRWLG